MTDRTLDEKIREIAARWIILSPKDHTSLFNSCIGAILEALALRDAGEAATAPICVECALPVKACRCPDAPDCCEATFQRLGWQPITTAPRDGTHIRVGRFNDPRDSVGFGYFNGKQVPMQTVAHWFNDGFYVSVYGCDEPSPIAWTHWKPLDTPTDAAPVSLHAATVERCAKVCEDEKVDADGTRQPEDYAYNKACDHCAAAVRQLAPETERVSVPREPTEAMIAAYLKAQKESALKSDLPCGISDPKENFRAGYRAMLAAASGEKE